MSSTLGFRFGHRPASFILPAILLLSLPWVGCAGAAGSQASAPVAAASESLVLRKIGEARAREGVVVRIPGSLAVVDEAGDFHRPLEVEPSGDAGGGRTVVGSPDACPDPPAGLSPDGDPVDWIGAHGAVGPVADADVVVRVGPPPGPGPLDVQLAPMELQVRGSSRLVAATALELEAFPCRILVEDLSGRPGQEIALVWISAGGSGYTTGVTVFEVRRRP